MTSGVFHSVPVDSITIVLELRQRKIRSKDHISNLAKSINEHGLIHPIVITRDHVLVAGECRLTAIRDVLKWTNITAQYQDELEERVLWGIELEENISRVDLDWRDKTKAIARYHALCKQNDANWSQSKTAEVINSTQQNVQKHLKVADYMSDPKVAEADSLATAHNIVRRREERMAADEYHAHNGVVGTPQSSIQLADFNVWAPSYLGPKFNLIHCDFPYGINADKHPGQHSALQADYSDTEDVYWTLFDTLALHLDRFCAESAHMIFWFSPQLYWETWVALQDLEGFRFEPYPLIWQRGVNEGIAPDPSRRPRRVYEMAFFGWRNDRKIIQTKANAIIDPTSRDQHPHEKSEIALRHFFEMCVDANTRILDPTCGSGSALRAAKSLGARELLGLETNSEYADAARQALSRGDV